MATRVSDAPGVRWVLLFLICAVGAIGPLQTPGFAQGAAVPDAQEIKAVLQDDAKFAQLMTETWVLRDLLALQQGGDISSQTKEFQGLQDQLRSHRATLMNEISGESLGTSAMAEVQKSAGSLAATLDRFGVRADSTLGKRLNLAYLQFSQLLAASRLEPLCKIYPFQEVC